MAKLTARFGNFVQWMKRPHLNFRTKSVATAEAPGDGGLMVETMEMEEAVPMRRPAKESTVDKLQRGYEEMVNLMGSVRNHLETQAEKSERLLTILQGLPEALKSLPEATRNQTRTLEAIQSNLTQQVQHNTKLADALNGLAKSTQHHEHAMSAIGQQLDAGHQRSEQILGSFNTLTGTLGRMTDANEASTGLLRRMAEQESQAAEQVRQLFVRNQKQMTTMSVVSWSLAIVALTVAGYVAVSVSKLSGQSQSQINTPSVINPAPTDKPAAIPAKATELQSQATDIASPGAAPAAAPAAGTPATTPSTEKPVFEEANKTSLLETPEAIESPDAVESAEAAAGEAATAKADATFVPIVDEE